MRVSKGAKFSDYMHKESSRREENLKTKNNKTRGFKFDFKEQNQQQESPKMDQEQTPINLLLFPTPSTEKINKSQREVKVVSSHILVPEDHQNYLPFETSDTNIAHAQIKQYKAQEKEKDISKQEQYIERLFINLLQNYNQPTIQILENSQKSQPSDKIVSFFKFSQLITKISKRLLSKTQQINQANKQLEIFISNLIAKLTKQNSKDLNLDTFPEIFAMMLTNNQENHIDKLLSSNQVQKALTITQISDKAFLNFPSKYATTHLKLQLNCLRQEDLQYLKRSSWILQIGVVAMIFEKNIYEYGSQIIKRQLQFKKHILPSEFLLFCLQWKKLSLQNRLQNRNRFNIGQDQIINLVNSVVQMQYHQLWQFFIILKAYVDKYPRAFNLVLEKVVRKLKKPHIFLEFLSLLQCEVKQITPLFNIYINENQNILKKPQIIKELKKLILQGPTNKTKKVALKLTEWVELTQLKQLQSKKNYEQYLIKLVLYYEKLQKSDLVNFKGLLTTMRQIITDFRICCNYKANKRIQTYHLLCDLERKIHKNQKQYLDIILGCKSFLQLKQGIFCLNEKDKLKSLEYLYSFLQKQSKRFETQKNQAKKQNVMKVLKNLQDALLKMLQTNSGRIYLSQLCKQLSKQKQSIFQQNGLDILSKSKGSKFSILMQILSQKQQILNYMALLLGFK